MDIPVYLHEHIPAVYTPCTHMNARAKRKQKNDLYSTVDGLLC